MLIVISSFFRGSRGSLGRLAALLVAATIQIGCDRPASDAPNVVDSAGIEIITIPRPRASLPLDLALAAKPTFDAGGIRDGEINAEVGPDVRAVRLSTGAIAAIDGTTFKLFDRAGKAIRITGRRGVGPGEFRKMVNLCLSPGDSVVVFDSENRHFTIFDANGVLIRQVILPLHARVVDDGCAGDGTIIVSQPNGIGLRGLAHQILTRVRLDGTVVDTLGTFIWLNAAIEWKPSGEFGRISVITALSPAARGWIVVGDGYQGDLEVYSLEHPIKLRRIIRFSDPRTERRGMLMATLSPDSARIPPREGPRAYEPLYSAVEIGADGAIWIQDYRDKDDKSATRKVTDYWTKVDSLGNVAGRLAIPNPDGVAVVQEFGPHDVLLGRDDESGARHLSTFHLDAR